METNKNYLSISNINKKVFRYTFLLYETENLNYVNEYDKITIKMGRLQQYKYKKQYKLFFTCNRKY